MRRWRLLSAILLVGGVTGCGSSAAVGGRGPSPAVIATSATTTTRPGTLPFTQPTKADASFATRLGARCRPIRLALTGLAPPTTLAGQASFSDLERQRLTRLRTAIASLTPPADLVHQLRAYRRALRGAIQSDGFVADAAKSQEGEGVAYWLSRRARAMDAVRNSSALLGAPPCEL